MEPEKGSRFLFYRGIVPDDVTDADYFRVQVVGLEKGQIIKTNKVLVRQEG